MLKKLVPSIALLAMSSHAFGATCQFENIKYVDNSMNTLKLAPFEKLYLATYTVGIEAKGTTFNVSDSLACTIQGSDLENCSKKLSPVDFTLEEEKETTTITSIRGEFVTRYEINNKTNQIDGFILNRSAGLNIILRNCKPLT